VGSVDEGMDAESRPPVHPWTLGLGLDMARRKDKIKRKKAFKEKFSEKLYLFFRGFRVPGDFRGFSNFFQFNFMNRNIIFVY